MNDRLVTRARQRARIAKRACIAMGTGLSCLPWILGCGEARLHDVLDGHTPTEDAGGSSEAPGEKSSPRLELTGELRAHDPALIRDEAGRWYVFSTGDPAVASGSIQIRRSSNLHEWELAGTVFDAIPDWVREAVPGVENLWAPDVLAHEGQFYLYYSASTFGSNRSVIGLATNVTLDPESSDYRWVDQGLVTESFPENDYNAIDPSALVDSTGRAWLAFGSFWSGIRMLAIGAAAGVVTYAIGHLLGVTLA